MGEGGEKAEGEERKLCNFRLPSLLSFSAFRLPEGRRTLIFSDGFPAPLYPNPATAPFSRNRCADLKVRFVNFHPFSSILPNNRWRGAFFSGIRLTNRRPMAPKSDPTIWHTCLESAVRFLRRCVGYRHMRNPMEIAFSGVDI